MLNKPVVLVAFTEQDNLGIGYITSVLLQDGYDIKIIDFRTGKEAILEQIRRYDPLVVGFSIIFQYHIDVFKDLIFYLREQGVNCHLSAGGHYPSLRYNELLDFIPQLDSVVLYEGEYTFLELVQSIYACKDWKHIRGIAFRDNGNKVINPLRPLEKDLDKFPPPARQPLREYALGRKYATLLAGRGCMYNCSFCSIREFYSKPPGPLKRIRRPEMVVREMELLHDQLDCSVFMFQDDDFPVARNTGKEWCTRFCELLEEKELSHKILWKINCRPDEVEADIFKLMRDSGLFLVYLGIESGTDDGLRLMNKHIKSETNIKAVNILKQLGINYDYGFMLFDPSSTHHSIIDNLNFLEKICGDGSSPITFCKMLPYAETKIEQELKKEGRLKGCLGFLDYDFKDISLNHLYSFMGDCFEDWITDHDGLQNVARWARYYLAVYNKFFPITSRFKDIDNRAQEVISHSNLYFINTVRTLASMSSLQDHKEQHNTLRIIKKDVAIKHSEYKLKLNEVINNIESLAN